MRKFLALFAVAAFLITACSPGSPTTGASPAPQASPTEQATEADIALSGPVQVTLWHNQSGSLGKALDEMIKDFNSSNGKGITVKGEFQGNYTQIYQKMLGAIQAGTVPEAVVAVENQVADYARAGIVVGLDEYINSKKNGLSAESLKDIYQPYIDSNRYPQYGDRILSFPFLKSLEIMMVNDDLLKELGYSAHPKTWAEFEEMARKAKLVGPDGKVTRWGWAGMGSEAFLSGVLTRGGEILKSPTEVGFGGKEGLETLKLYDRCIKEEFCYVPKGFDWQDRFGEGNLLFATGTSTGRPFIKAAFKKPINWSIFGMPTDGTAPSRTIAFGAVIAITKSTPEKQLAVWEFLKWFSDTEQTTKVATISAYMPLRASALDDAKLKEQWAGPDVQGKQAFDLVPTSAAGPSIRGWQEVRDAIFEALTKIQTKQASPEDALATAVRKSNAVLEENE